MPATRLIVNPVACSGHGSCAELLPELVALDEWGYPLLAPGPVPAPLERAARRAVRDCPALALRLVSASVPGSADRVPGSGERAPGSEETQKSPRTPARAHRAR
jgi:ferredoxin